MDETTTDPFAAYFSPKIAKEFIDMTGEFITGLSKALMDGMWLIFLSIIGIWIVWHGIRMAFGKSDLPKLMGEFGYIFLAGVLLGGQGAGLVKKLFDASLSLMGAGAAVAIEAVSIADPGLFRDVPPPGDFGGAGDGILKLMAAVERGVIGVFTLAGNMLAEGAWHDLTPKVLAIVLVLPYAILLIAFLAQVVVSIFRITVIAGFSPYLMLAVGFGWGRENAKAAGRTWLASLMVLYASTMAIALVLFAVKRLGVGEGSEDPELLKAMMSPSSPELWMAIVMGYAGTFFLTIATELANSVTQSSLTNQAAAGITAGVIGSALAVAKKTKGLAFGAATGGVGAAVGAVAGAVSSGTASGGVIGGVQGFGHGSGLSQAGQAAMERIYKTRGYGPNGEPIDKE